MTSCAIEGCTTQAHVVNAGRYCLKHARVHAPEAGQTSPKHLIRQRCCETKDCLSCIIYDGGLSSTATVAIDCSNLEGNNTTSAEETIKCSECHTGSFPNTYDFGVIVQPPTSQPSIQPSSQLFAAIQQARGR